MQSAAKKPDGCLICAINITKGRLLSGGMRILLYEPGKSGHRTVYLGYIATALRQRGEVLVVTDSFAHSPYALVQYAKREHCNVIFVCTLDGMFPWLVKLGIASRLSSIRIAGIYYQFHNLYHGWKSLLWCALICSGLLSKVFVPDFCLGQRKMGRVRKHIVFIADPWDRRKLFEVTETEARRVCGLGEFQGCVFLVFGEITERKGVALIMDAFSEWDYSKRPHFRVLIAGRADAAMAKVLGGVSAIDSRLGNRVVVHDRWISEDEHPYYFSAASYLCAIYPHTFCVSISTAIRSVAVKRPVVVGNHGVIGKTIKRMGAGIVCDAASPQLVRVALETAYDCYCNNREAYTAQAVAGEQFAAENELTNFTGTLIKWRNSL